MFLTNIKMKLNDSIILRIITKKKMMMKRKKITFLMKINGILRVFNQMLNL